MSIVGQIERKTQQRVVKLFRDTLDYAYLGDWTDRIGNRNIEEDLLRKFLRERQGYDEALITRALHLLDKAAGDASKSLYDRNRDVYSLLRYAVKVKPGVGENTVDVWLIDWEHPENNHFAIAEEVTVAAVDDKAHEKRPDVVLYVNGIALGVLELKRSTISVAEDDEDQMGRLQRGCPPDLVESGAREEAGAMHRVPGCPRARPPRRTSPQRFLQQDDGQALAAVASASAGAELCAARSRELELLSPA